MTYTLATTPKENLPTLLPGLPYGPDILDTSGMRSVLPALILRILAMINPEYVERGALARLWEARRMFASVYRAEVYNLSMWLITTLQGDRDWRRQVREDLGGEAALTRWDKRYAKKLSGETSAPRKATAVNPPLKSHAKSKIRTDRHTLFRLAKISTAKAQKRIYTPPMFTPSRNAWLTFPKPALIPLTPDQLREPKPGTVKHFGADGIETAVLSGSTDNMPTLTRPAIMAAWYDICHEYWMFNFKIMNLDLMMTTNIGRRMPMLPV